jgi:N-acetylmuramic acid 6-phosphate etherase
MANRIEPPTTPAPGPDPAQPYYIGINGGGTRTSLVAVNRNLDILARVQTGPTNPFNVGLAQAQATLHAALNELAAKAGYALDDVAAIGAGIAGIDRPEDKVTFRTVFDGPIPPTTPIILENDGTVALLAGVGRPFGVICISGTGSIAIGIDPHGTLLRSGGWGWLMDSGSGYAMGREALVAIADAHDGAGPQTALTGRILERLGLPTPPALIGWMYAPDRDPSHLAALAAEVVKLAEVDPIATGILVRGADALAHSVYAVIGRLQFDPAPAPIPLVMSGGIFDNATFFRERFIQTLHTRLPNIQPMLATREAALGAAMLAIRHFDETAIFPTGATQYPLPDLRGTEQRNRLTMHIGAQSTADLLYRMNFEDERIPEVIAPLIPKLAAFIDTTAEKFRAGGRLLMLGAGTSGRLAVLDAAECIPTFSVEADQVIGILAGGPDAMIHSLEGAEDYAADGAAQISTRGVGPLDTVIGVAASGSTPFVVGALREARKRGALTGAIYNVVGGAIGAVAEYAFEAATGPEVITGSTRLRAGTAQKLILNMITTALMVRAGRTLGNLMTDMRASNLKLSGRAIRIVAEGAGVPLADAERLLSAAGGEMKTAIAAARLGLSVEAARAAVAGVDGDLAALLRAHDRRPA